MGITVTGGCGFIGQHLVARLLNSGHRVTVLDDLSTGDVSNLQQDPDLRLIRGCVTDPVAIARAIEGANLIFHLAAVVGQVNVCKRPGWSVHVSSESVRLFNRLAPDVPLILFSSSAVYGLTNSQSCREDEAVTREMALCYDGGQEGYSYGKWLAERLVGERAPDMSLVVRPFNVIGPGQVGTYGMVVPRFVRNALAGAPVTIYGNGFQTRSFGDVDSFLDHLLALVEAWPTRHDGAIYNIGTPVETSINHLIDTIDRVLGTRTRRRHADYAAVYSGKEDVQRRRPSLERIERLLGPLAWPDLASTIRKIAAISGARRATVSIPAPPQLAG